MRWKERSPLSARVRLLSYGDVAFPLAGCVLEHSVSKTQELSLEANLNRRRNEKGGEQISK